MQHNFNVFYLPNMGENLTDEDVSTFYVAGLPLPSFAHGPRGCVADYYAADDRRDAGLMAKAAACEGGAHHVWLATQGMDVYERMAFDRL